MKLLSNPIFLTQKRLVNREGFWPGVSIVGLLGLCIFLSAANALSDLRQGLDHKSIGIAHYSVLNAVQLSPPFDKGVERVAS